MPLPNSRVTQSEQMTQTGFLWVTGQTSMEQPQTGFLSVSAEKGKAARPKLQGPDHRGLDLRQRLCTESGRVRHLKLSDEDPGPTVIRLPVIRYFS